ncbi:MAG: LamG-like jellyroll fold domain-containing protein, partial [Candidatus Poribacteria bacterium]
IAKSEGPGTDGQGPKTLFISNGTLTFDTGWVGQFGGIAAVADGEWHHVGVTVDIVDGEDPIQFYVDGDLDQLGQMDVNAFPPIDAELVMIGLDGRADLEFPPFTGLIDEVGIYDRVLTDEEMASNAAATAGLTVDPKGKAATTWGRMKTRD